MDKSKNILFRFRIIEDYVDMSKKLDEEYKELLRRELQKYKLPNQTQEEKSTAIEKTIHNFDALFENPNTFFEVIPDQHKGDSKLEDLHKKGWEQIVQEHKDKGELS